MASLVGAVFVLASLAAVFYGVPKLWEMTVAPAITPTLGGLFNGALVIFAQFAATILLIILGSRLGGNPPAGIRGGIFLAISTIFTVFFLARAVGMIVQSAFSLANPVALAIFLGAVGGFGFIALGYLRGSRFRRTSVALEDGGWFSTFSHKRNQGRTVRRLTMVAIFIIAGAGIQTLIQNQHLIGLSDWEVVTPFLPFRVVLLPDAQFTVPLVLIFLAVWTAWRLINYPPFADFLIATEAEMNKVSWTPRKALIRDTLVVLSTVFIIAMFIFVVDIFWGWLLSREIVGVLPRSTNYYYVELRELPEEKRESVIQILSSEAVGYPTADAQKVAETVPTAWVEGKSAPIRIKSLQQRDVKRSGFDEATSDRLVRRLQEAGAKVSRVPAKDDTKNVW